MNQMLHTLWLILLVTSQSESCRPTTTSQAQSSDNTITQNCEAIPSNATSKCLAINTNILGYNKTSKYSVTNFTGTTPGKWGPYKLCNVSQRLPKGSCNCSTRILKFAWRLYMPECLENGSPRLKFPCQNYCTELNKRCGQRIPVNITSEILRTLSVSSLSKICSVLNDSNCWGNSSELNGCTFPTTTTYVTTTTRMETTTRVQLQTQPSSPGSIAIIVVCVVAGVVAVLLVTGLLVVRIVKHKRGKSARKLKPPEHYGTVDNIIYHTQSVETDRGVDEVVYYSAPADNKQTENACPDKENKNCTPNDVSALYTQVKK